ncbi:MAG TPA: gamma-glutamyltransferase [Xanthobacteraceae bacterium]|nr:gamma-glutamyltransferase [Xanthobacteraceae bacterium]
MRQWRTIPLIAAGLAASISLLLITPVAAEDRSQARSMVISQYGIVAAEQPIAARAGTAVLERGGNAIDAAVAANAAMGLVAPMMDGMGGDLFAIVYEAKSNKVYGLNASGWAPKGLTPEFLHSKSLQWMPSSGIHSVTVPGAVAGWDALLARFGKKTFVDVLAPTIGYAKAGFPVTEIFGDDWQGTASYVSRNREAARVYLPNGRAPAVGEIFRNPDLAGALEEIAKGGRDAFYKGTLAKRMLDTSGKLGGTMAADDLSEFAVEWVDPISTDYRGWTVYEMPPNEQGIAALMMLNIMNGFPLSEWGHNSVATLHAMIEAKKLAYADMITYVGDPRFAEVPTKGMISATYGRSRAILIDPAKANCSVGPGTPPYAGSDTTYLSTVDRDGNMVSLIQSNFSLWGSGIAVEGAGFVLHNRGALFTLDPKHPNVLAGRKRPLHTIIPALMAKGDVRIAFGIMGGFNQAQAHAQFVSNVVDHGMNIQAAMEAPRFSKASFAGCDLYAEGRIPDAVFEGLAKLGHQVQALGDFSEGVGGGQAVMRHYQAGVNYGASDPRKDGQAIAEMPGAR